MNKNPEHLIYNWLRSMKIPVSKTFLKQQLAAHTDYPSLVSITDTLDELNIENGAFVVEKEKLNEVPVPFLVHSKAKGGEFELITDLNKYLKQYPGFEKQWDGIAVVAEKPEHFENPENEKMLKQEKRNSQMLWFFLLLISGLSLFSAAINFHWEYAGLLITTILGLSVPILVMQQELGISNEFTEQLCSAGKNTDCHAVMHPKANSAKDSAFLKWLDLAGIGLADAAIIYFGSLFILLTISLLHGAIQSFLPVLFLLAVLSLPVTLFSVYYQWRVVKKWCPLCLATVAVLWIQFALTIGAEPGELMMSSWNAFSLNEFLFALFILSTITAAWQLLIKPALLKNMDIISKNFSLQRFKNNPEVFNALLQQQRKVDTTPFEHDLQLGNPDADLQIIVACNPYCAPCAKAHKTLHELTEKNDIGLTVRFTINTASREDKKLQAVQYILQSAKNKPAGYKRKLLYDWYAGMDFEKFSNKHPLNDNKDVEELLKQNEDWSNASEIKFTPTIFINGYELPKQYKAEDLRILIRVTENKERINSEKYIAENDLIPV